MRFLLSACALLLLAAPCTVQGFLRSSLFPSHEPANVFARENILGSKSPDSGALFLTPYIEKGEIDKAQSLAKVRAYPGSSDAKVSSLESYSGFLTVNKSMDSNMFFWFFPAQKPRPNAPVVLWLQGGPGGSSLFGLFVENGPLVVSTKMNVTLNPYSWNNDMSMLYIDNPVGTGFSFTMQDAGYARNEDDVARDLYAFLKQFFQLFPTHKNLPFYVTGESYAGKYVPAIANKIVEEGQAAKDAGISLAGAAIGDGLCDPRTMGNYGDFLFQAGLIDSVQLKHFKSEQRLAYRYIDDGDFKSAFKVFDRLLNGDLTNGTSYFKSATGLTFYYNHQIDVAPADFNNYVQWLGQKNVRDAIHVGSLTYNDGVAVETHIINDIMDTVKPRVENILNNDIPILFYSGQLDIIVATPLTESFLNSLEWKGEEKYRKSERILWKVDATDIAPVGYVRHAKNLIFATVRKAGHILPYDQPRVAYDMIHRFVNLKSFKGF